MVLKNKGTTPISNTKELVLGLGNPILGDDGVGLWIARELKGRLKRQDVTVVEASSAGLDTLELFTSYDRTVIIDSIRTKEGMIGQIYQLDLNALDATRHAAHCHDINLATTITLGRQLKFDLSSQIDIFAIEVADVPTFSEDFTPELNKVKPTCIDIIAHELEGD